MENKDNGCISGLSRRDNNRLLWAGLSLGIFLVVASTPHPNVWILATAMTNAALSMINLKNVNWSKVTEEN